MRATPARFLRCERGATAIEYGMVASLIAVVLVVAVAALADSLESTFQGVDAALPQTGNSGHGPPPGIGNGDGNNGNGKGNGGSGG